MTLATTMTYVRQNLRESPYEDVLGAACAAAATSMTTTLTATKIKLHDIVEFQNAGEQAIATADGAGTTVSIRKGHNGTTDATVPNGTRFLLKPTYYYDQIESAITEVCNAIFPRVWVETTTTITPSTSANIYNLPTGYEGFLGIFQAATGNTDVVRPIVVEYLPNVPTAILANGHGLRIQGWPRTDVNATLFYKAVPTTSNMPSGLERIVALGAAQRLAKRKAAQLSRFQGAGEQSQVRDLLTSANFLEDEFQRDLNKYAAKLAPHGHVRNYIRATTIGG